MNRTVAWIILIIAGVVTFGALAGIIAWQTIEHPRDSLLVFAGVAAILTVAWAVLEVSLPND